VTRKNSVFLWYAILALVYIVLSLVLPVNTHTLHQLHLSLYQYRVLVFVVILPYVLIWFAAFYAYYIMDAYTKLLGKEREAPAFKQMTRGVQVMAWGLAVPAILSTILKAIGARHDGFEQTATIIGNYLTLLVPLIAFTFISNGSRMLTDLLKIRPGKNGMRILVLLFIAFGVIYTTLTLIARKSHGNPYHLTRPLTMFTIIVPYLYAWYLGLMSCYELVLFAKKIKGLLYKRALNRLASGIGLVIGSSIFIQFINIVYAYKDNNSLGSLLMLIYLLLTVEAIGYILIVVGGKNLKRIEEI
jgi:hypothetical protein